MLFFLEISMIDYTRPVQTRSGLKARILCTDLNNYSNTLVVACTDKQGIEFVMTRNRDGSQCMGYESPGDIINVPERHKHYDLIIKWATDKNTKIKCRVPGTDEWFKWGTGWSEAYEYAEDI